MVFMLVIISIWVVGIVGWVLNIIKIVKTLNANKGQQTPVSAMFIARCIGVIAAPLGTVLGFMKG